MLTHPGRARGRIAAPLPGPGDVVDLRRAPRRDMAAGLTVAIVALPLVLGFGVSSGLGAMSTSRTTVRRAETPAAQALGLPAHSTPGRLVHARCEQTVVRPARCVGECGRPAVGTPVPDTAVPATVTYHADGIRGSGGAGTVTRSGPAEVIAGRAVGPAARHRRAPAGWTCGPHDTLPLIRPTTVSGF
ncbi:hypothetical protein [Streptomyces shenzhenensis]|uniref:hypothetical protein n=1 Tax=Streptomyces shenzhenensis TaxID=943815 RepID=UPI003F54032D